MPAVLKGCAWLALAGLLAGAFLYTRLAATIRWGMAESLRLFASRVCERLQVPDEEQLRLLGPIGSYAAEIEAGRSPVIPAFRVMCGFDGGPLLTSLLLTSFQAGFLASPPAGFDVDAARRASCRFFTGVRAGRIPPATVASLALALTEEREITYRSRSTLVIRETARVLRRALAPAELRDLVLFLGGEADGASIGPEAPGFDPLRETLTLLASETGWRPLPSAGGGGNAPEPGALPPPAGP